VDLGGDELLLGDGDAGDDDDGEGDGIDGSLDAADVGQGKAGQTGEVLQLHFGLRLVRVKELERRKPMTSLSSYV
jgi:hypothetical protein